MKYAFCLKFMTVFAAVIFSCIPIFAQQEVPDPYELNFEDNLNTPAIQAKSQPTVKERGDRLRNVLSKAGFNATLVRNGEVILVTIPCADLFVANEATMTSKGIKLLNSFNLPEDCREKYKVLIAVHSDDTGEPEYSDDLTAARSNLIDDIISPKLETIGIISIPYGLGQDEPLKPNDSFSNRAANRRTEIYIVPLL